MPNGPLIKAIWAAAREHGISRDEVHDATFAGWKKTSVKQLSDAEARQLLDGMRGKKRRRHIPHDRRQAMGNDGRKDDPGGTEYLINDSERQLLWQAAFTRDWSEETLRAFCVKMIGIPEPKTIRQYNKVFWAIKAMQRRDQQKRDRAAAQVLEGAHAARV
jgi:hypothetical protein